tara:strand:- start:477 stop:686 length:210 start_codon:yes stop_codon:yes gene_type:complete
MTDKKDTRRDAWNFDYLGMRAYGTPREKKYHDWVYMADDQMNKVLKTVVIALHIYGLWVVLVALWEKYT